MNVIKSNDYKELGLRAGKFAAEKIKEAIVKNRKYIQFQNFHLIIQKPFQILYGKENSEYCE